MGGGLQSCLGRRLSLAGSALADVTAVCVGVRTYQPEREIAIAGGLIAVARHLVAVGAFLIAARLSLIGVRDRLVAVGKRLPAAVDEQPFEICTDRDLSRHRVRPSMIEPNMRAGYDRCFGHHACSRSRLPPGTGLARNEEEDDASVRARPAFLGRSRISGPDQNTRAGRIARPSGLPRRRFGFAGWCRSRGRTRLVVNLAMGPFAKLALGGRHDLR